MSNSNSNKSKKVFVVVSDGWYPNEINTFVDSLNKLVENIRIVRVNGCWEIPPKIVKIVRLNKPDNIIIIAVGAIVKGDTYHFEVLSHTVSDALMRLQIDHGVQIINQVLNCYSVDQIQERMSVDRAKYIVNNIF